MVLGEYMSGDLASFEIGKVYSKGHIFISGSNIMVGII